jgi:hypothetical protein
MRAALCWLAVLAAAPHAHALTVPVPLTCNPTCTSAVNAAVAACAAAAPAPCTVSLAAGVYTLDGPAYAARVTVPAGAANLAVVGAGDATTLLLSDIGTAFVVQGPSRNVTFASFAVDMARVPFTYGNVTASAPGGATVAFDASAGGLYPIDAARYPWLARAQGVLSYDPVNRRVAPGATDI